MAGSVQLNGRARGFVWGTVALGLTVLALSVRQVFEAGVDAQWVVLSALAALSGFAVLRLGSLPATFSFGETFSFAVLFLYGPAAAAVTAALDSVACNLRLKKLAPIQLVFNVAAPALAMWVAGTLVFRVAGLALPVTTPPMGMALAATAIAACLFFFIESGLLAVAIALHRGKALRAVWADLLRLWLDPIAGAYIGFLVAFFNPVLGMTSLLLIVPVPLLLYYGFNTWLGRLDDRVHHLAEMGSSYQSIVESFAIAVDAKDQVTHGHIRRVQQYGLALARHVGVTDAGELLALETAALLHDVGKLAIPERILNKPGRLTPAEFEQMKEHVLIGTRILSTARFPYPIVPIVRHHHENWDGTGYPDGIVGEAIPIGARILMIVDCFDALTSDRPYRRRLSTEAAFEILIARRGTMYDAHLVDEFIRLQPALERRARLVEPAPASDEPARSLLPEPTLVQRESVNAIGTRLPGWLCAFWEHRTDTDMVAVRHATGPGAERVIGCALACGAGVSGWVVANGAAMEACDGRLDLGSLLDHLPCSDGTLQAFSVPATLDGATGAVTVYRADPTAAAALDTADVILRGLDARAGALVAKA